MFRLTRPRGSIVAAFAAVIVIGGRGGAAAQRTATEVWPEVDILWSPAVHQRTMLELSGTNEREADKQQGTMGIYQDALFLPVGFLRVGGRITVSLGDASYREERLVAEAVVSREVATGWRLVNRSRAEPRWVNGIYSYRIRDRVQFQRQARPGEWKRLAPLVAVEAFYDSRYTGVARVVARAGNAMRFGERQSLELSLARQSDLQGTPRRIAALGVTYVFRY